MIKIKTDLGAVISILPERQRIAKIFKKHIEAIEELGIGYNVTLQEKFDKNPIHIKIEINSKTKNQTIIELTPKIIKSAKSYIA